jgi:hypothetical protein
VWAMAVVVTGVEAKHTFEVRLVDNHLVEALRSHGAHERLGKSARVRGPIGAFSGSEGPRI